MRKLCCRLVFGVGVWSSAVFGARAGEPAPTQLVSPKGGAGAGTPALEQTYAGYDPGFSQVNRQRIASDAGLRESLRFSRQKHYVSMADVQMDAQVQPLIKRANELVARGEYRKATPLYRAVIEEFGDDLYLIAEEGIFIPASLYAQRQILAYPKKELEYYRVMFDPAARDIYQLAVKRYSIFDYKEIMKQHLATSYGDDALFALGNAALDGGRYNEARRYYELLLECHGATDEDSDTITLNRDQVWVRLAICYKHLGRDKDFRDAVSKVADRSEPTVAKLMAQLERFIYNEFDVRQREGRRSARYDAADDRCLSEPMPYSFSANRGEWRVPLARRDVWLEPEALPWATETDLIYKDMNVLYSRSLLTGELNWSFGPGGVSADWDYNYGGPWVCGPNFYPQQSILVHDGVVFASLFVFGPSLVAVDQYTGRLLWAKGPMAAVTEEEWLDRYQASPAAGRGMVVVPIVRDDIRGRTHISSSADLAAFKVNTGEVLWRTTLARISPLKITQSHYPRKIRILSTTPLVNEGVVYHSSNAGVVVAVDAETGNIRWLTRYPQNMTVLDNFANTGRTWTNMPPLIRGNKLYVTPVDSPLLLCIDTETGRVLWTATQSVDSNWWKGHGGGQQGYPLMQHLVGFTPDGALMLARNDLAFLDPETGRLLGRARLSSGDWLEGGDPRGKVLKLTSTPPKGLAPSINGEGDDYWWYLGTIGAMPTLTRDGKVFFAMRSFHNDTGGWMFSEYCLDLKDRNIEKQRRWHEGNHNALPVAKQVVNEEPEIFKPAQRMAFTRWGVPFEIDVTTEHIVARYDHKKLEQELSRSNDLNTLFARAEIARRKGDLQESIKTYESCKNLLPSEEEDMRRNLNLRLYPLYMTLARWGYQSGDLNRVEWACKQMGASASTPSQEIRALLAFSELHERRGDWDRAAAVLRNASRHYWREPLMTTGLETGNQAELLATAEKALANLQTEVPAVYAAVAREMAAREKARLSDYFLAVADVEEDRLVETRALIARRLLALVDRSPETFRKRYEEQAAAELKAVTGLNVGERALWCWPGSAAGRAKLAELYAQGEVATGVDKVIQTWKLDDLGEVCGLKGAAPHDPAPPPPGLPTGEGWAAREEANGEPDIVRLALPQRNGGAETSHFLFVGGRKRSAYGNRFTVGCWDMRAGRKLWETREILLHGKTMAEEGYETGFEELWTRGELAIVHGRYDVVAIRWAPDKDLDSAGRKEKAWHFRTPLGFEIQNVGMQGSIIVLCGRRGTVALWAETGEIIWDAPEDGEYYAGPFFHKDTVLTVRNSPAAVSFRRLGSGRLLSCLRLPGLTTNRKHPLYMAEAGTANPAAAEAVEAYPVAFADGKLAVVDGRNYHMIDVATQEREWSTPVTKLDPAMDPSFRLWLHGGRLFVLKPYYSVLENAVFDVASGDLLWRRREGGKKADEKLKKIEGAVEGKELTGVLGSMVFVGGKVYGIRYEMGSSTVALVGMDPETGNELMRVEQKGYEDPEAYVEPSASENCVVVRVQAGNRYEVWQVDVAAGKLVQKLSVAGHGRLGQYGDVSAVWQGPHLAIWTHPSRHYTAPNP